MGLTRCVFFYIYELLRLTMDRFNFTHQKFKKQTPERQQKWIIQWLTGIYQDVMHKKITHESFLCFFENYKHVLEWCGEPGLKRPADNNRQILEFLSDRIHIHRLKMGSSPKDHNLLPETRYHDRVSEKPWAPVFSHIIALDGLRSVFNTGSVFRICDAAGFASVLLGNTLGKENSGVRKTSMGAVEWIPQKHTKHLTDELIKYKKKGYQIIGVETVEGSSSYHEFKWHDRCVLVFGNEEYGISSTVLSVCDDFVYIKMHGRKNSINVANAVSVICFDIACR